MTGRISILAVFLLGVSGATTPTAEPAAEFQSLFNGRDLTGWETYLGIAEVPGLPFDLFGDWPASIGRGADERGVYAVVEVDGAPAIRISGEIWGALISEREYENYHLRLEYKWGERRFEPRASPRPISGSRESGNPPSTAC